MPQGAQGPPVQRGPQVPLVEELKVPQVQQELLVVAQVPHVVGPQEPKMPQAPKVPQVPMVLLVEALQVQSRAMRRQRRLAWRSEGTLSEGTV